MPPIARTVVLLFIVGVVALSITQGVHSATLELTAERVVLKSEFVHAEFDLVNPQLDILKGAFHANNAVDKAPNVLNSQPDFTGLQRKGVVLERDSLENGVFTSVASSLGAAPGIRVQVLANTSAAIMVSIANVLDSPKDAAVNSTWILHLVEGKHFLAVTCNVLPLPLTPGRKIVSVRLGMYFAPVSVFGHFTDRGVMQMMDNANVSMASNASLHRFYTLGINATADVMIPQRTYTQLVLTNEGFAHTGLQVVLAGAFPVLDTWMDNAAGWPKASPVTLDSKGYALTVTVYANNYDFPLSAVTSFDEKGRSPMIFDELRTYYTSTYASTVGTMVSYFPWSQGQVGASLHWPVAAYSWMYNFFDPDSFFTIGGLAYINEPFLWNEARKILERNMDVMLPTGQLPHHFINNSVTYIAISGATQTGPNIFWLLSSLQYVKSSGDYAWLQTNMPKLELALGFLKRMYNTTVNMVNSPGSLMIDVFIRNNFTSDTNAIMVYLLHEIADAEELLNNKTAADANRKMADDISAAMNKYLWSPTMKNHYVTQMNLDGSLRDFIDYDSNYMAVAFGIPDLERSKAIVDLINNSTCRVRPTYVSGIYYNEQNCYGGNTGDSAVDMGRIGWAEGHARRRIGDKENYLNKVVGPVRADLFRDTWLWERYTCDGRYTHNPYYHEYPEFLVRVITEVSYGLTLGLTKVIIDPFIHTADFVHHLGDTYIRFSADLVEARNIKGRGYKAWTVTNLRPNTRYQLATSAVNPVELTKADVQTDAAGVAKFSAMIGQGVHVVLTRV